jgi:hypothetical protein
MARIGKISVIQKDYSKGSGVDTMERSLFQKNLTRVPGTTVTRHVYKELDGKYRTGLDPEAGYINRIKDNVAREAEIERVSKLKVKLEKALGVDLSPRSNFWNSSKASKVNDAQFVSPAKLQDGVNYFDLEMPMQELTFSWLRVHPTIASSYQAYMTGEYPADTQFYVVDEEMENDILYKKKKLVNDAISKFNTMGITKQRKIARLLGLPISDDTKEEVVYNLVDNLLKKTEMDKGTYEGLNPVEVFSRFADMKENLVHVKDLIEQALMHTIYRIKPNGFLYEGDFEIAKSKDEYAKLLVDDDNQSELLELEGKLKMKKLVNV